MAGFPPGPLKMTEMRTKSLEFLAATTSSYSVTHVSVVLALWAIFDTGIYVSGCEMQKSKLQCWC